MCGCPADATPVALDCAHRSVCLDRQRKDAHTAPSPWRGTVRYYIQYVHAGIAFPPSRPTRVSGPQPSGSVTSVHHPEDKRGYSTPVARRTSRSSNSADPMMGFQQMLAASPSLPRPTPPSPTSCRHRLPKPTNTATFVRALTRPYVPGRRGASPLVSG